MDDAHSKIHKLQDALSGRSIHDVRVHGEQEGHYCSLPDDQYWLHHNDHDDRGQGTYDQLRKAIENAEPSRVTCSVAQLWSHLEEQDLIVHRPKQK